MIADQLMEEWHARYGPAPQLQKDAWMHAQVDILLNLMRRLEIILEDQHISPHMRRDILRELLLGGYPNPAEAEIRLQYQDMHTDLLNRLGLPWPRT